MKRPWSEILDRASGVDRGEEAAAQRLGEAKTSLEKETEALEAAKKRANEARSKFERATRDLVEAQANSTKCRDEMFAFLDADRKERLASEDVVVSPFFAVSSATATDSTGPTSDSAESAAASGTVRKPAPPSSTGPVKNVVFSATPRPLSPPETAAEKLFTVREIISIHCGPSAVQKEAVINKTGRLAASRFRELYGREPGTKAESVKHARDPISVKAYEQKDHNMIMQAFNEVNN